MDWTTCVYASNWKCSGGRRVVDRKAECDQICTRERKVPVKGADGHVYPAMKDTVLKSAMVGSVYYAAVRREQEGKEPRVWAAVFLTCGKGRTDGSVWGYTATSEDRGPFYYDCPAGILALLTPTDSENANKWRAKCRQTLSRKAEERKNGRKKIFVPAGVTLAEEGKAWILTSDAYREKCNYRYRGIRCAKSKWRDGNRAVVAFLEQYGTKEQKAEYAASGNVCPAGWKGVAA